MNVVITGTSRGIGLELTRQALAAQHQVVAVARKPEESEGLQKLKREHGDQLMLVAVDVTDPKASEKILSALPGWKHVDVLINNAGIMKRQETRQDFLDSFLVNSIVPFELTQAFLPLLRSSSSPKVVQMTSLMGSIADNQSGGYYSYRASKTALNMINKSLAIDNGWLTTIVMHPGWVKTAMGGEQAPLSAEESAQGIWKVINGLKPSDSGHFFNYAGKEYPW